MIRGQVQGVYFRASAKEIADRLGVKGIIRNEPDGSVSAEVEGPKAAVEAFVAWCRSGPSSATVTELTVSGGPLRGFDGFQVIR